MNYKNLVEIAKEIPNHSKLEDPELHDFLSVYEQYFIKRKNDNIKLIEIGIGQGGSPRIWKEYFPNAQIYGGDYDSNKLYQEDRITTFLFNQNNVNNMIEVGENFGKFDIFIDDGSHQMVHQINCLKTMWHYINNGGIYIIEDLHTSYWPTFGGKLHANTTIEFLKYCVDAINSLAIGMGDWVKIPVNANEVRNICEEIIPTINTTLSFIHFYQGLCILGKK
jgi:hypothetical protein